MYGIWTLLGLWLTLQVRSQAVSATDLPLRDSQTVQRWQVPSNPHNNYRIGRKFKDLDSLVWQTNKRSNHWGSLPDSKFKAVVIEDDSAHSLFEDNNKRFRENSHQKKENGLKLTLEKRDTPLPDDTDGAKRETRSAGMRQTDINKGSQNRIVVSMFQPNRPKRTVLRRGGNLENHASTSGVPKMTLKTSNTPVGVDRRALPVDDDYIRSARAAIARLENTRQVGLGRKGLSKLGLRKRDQMHVLSLNGVNPVNSQIMPEEDLKDKQLWNSRQEALRLLRGAGVNLEEVNKHKGDNPMKFNQQPSNHVQEKSSNEVHNQVQNRVHADQAPAVKDPQINNLAQTANSIKPPTGKSDKIINQIDEKNVKLSQGHGEQNAKVNPTSDAKENIGQKLKLDKGITNGELTQRTKIESPELSRKEKMRIVPSNVARAVAMAMEQLRRDKMWGKVFVHVLPSGKLKVMVQETKKMEDD